MPAPARVLNDFFRSAPPAIEIGDVVHEISTDAIDVLFGPLGQPLIRVCPVTEAGIQAGRGSFLHPKTLNHSQFRLVLRAIHDSKLPVMSATCVGLSLIIVLGMAVTAKEPTPLSVVLPR